MSVKFQETTKTKVTEAATAATDAAKKVGEKHEDLSHKIGEYLTGGDKGKGYLAVRDNMHVSRRRRGDRVLSVD